MEEDDIACSVYAEIEEAGFEAPMVDLLLEEASEGQIDLMGDVLLHLVKKGHADWAAELCRMLIHRPTAESTEPEPGYHTVTHVLRYMVDMRETEAARKACSFILVLKDDNQGGNYFDCVDLAMLLGNMVHYQHTEQAAEIIYSLYSDDTDEGRLYHTYIPALLGTLVDMQQPQWAVELAKQLMLNDDDYGADPVDYSVVGWCMAQMVADGRPDWAASICEGLRADRSRRFQLPRLLEAVAAWSSYEFAEVIKSLMASQAPGPSTGVHAPQPYAAYAYAHQPHVPYSHPQPPQMHPHARQQPRQQQGAGPRPNSINNHAAQQTAPNKGRPQAAPSQVNDAEIAELRLKIEMKMLQQRIQAKESAAAKGAGAAAGGRDASRGVAALDASMQGLNLQQPQPQEGLNLQQPQPQEGLNLQQPQPQEGAASNGAASQSMQAAIAAQPFVPRSVSTPPLGPRNVHAPSFVPRGGA